MTRHMTPFKLEITQHHSISSQIQFWQLPRVRLPTLDIPVRPVVVGGGGVAAILTYIYGIAGDFDFDLVCDEDGGNVAAQMRPKDGERGDDGSEVDFEGAKHGGRGAVPGWIEGGVGGGAAVNLCGKPCDGANDGPG